MKEQAMKWNMALRASTLAKLPDGLSPTWDGLCHVGRIQEVYLSKTF